MSKIPIRKVQRGDVDGRMSMRELADKLQDIMDRMWMLRMDVLGIYNILYSKGIADRGPITENKDDIPF